MFLMDKKLRARPVVKPRVYTTSRVSSAYSSASVLHNGFTLLELIVVMAIMAVLLAMAGLSIYSSRRSNLLLEQAAQELVSEIRLAQSRALSVQEIEADGEKFIPKAAIIRINKDTDPMVSYLKLNNPNNPDCTQTSTIKDKTFSLQNRASIKSPSSPIYLVYTAPLGRFYARSSSPDFEDYINNTCKPKDVNVVDDNIVITLTNDSQDYKIEINSESGGITVAPIPD